MLPWYPPIPAILYLLPEYMDHRVSMTLVDSVDYHSRQNWVRKLAIDRDKITLDISI